MFVKMEHIENSENAVAACDNDEYHIGGHGRLQIEEFRETPVCEKVTGRKEREERDFEETKFVEKLAASFWIK
jgi:hypothetical protein